MIRKRTQPGVVAYTYEPNEVRKFYEKNIHHAAITKLTEVVIKLASRDGHGTKDTADLVYILEKLKEVG